MANYRRLYRAGGTYFITVVTHGRRPLFDDPATRLDLREAVNSVRARHPFTIDELVLLRDHFHLILTLPGDDIDFSVRISQIKSSFTRSFVLAGGNEGVQSDARTNQRYRGVWQKRFWEHLIRDADDLAGCRRYCWYNPVKHRLAPCPHAWPWSTFHRAVATGMVEKRWSCACDGPAVHEQVHDIPGTEMD